MRARPHFHRGCFAPVSGGSRPPAFPTASGPDNAARRAESQLTCFSDELLLAATINGTWYGPNVEAAEPFVTYKKPYLNLSVNPQEVPEACRNPPPPPYPMFSQDSRADFVAPQFRGCARCPPAAASQALRSLPGCCSELLPGAKREPAGCP